MRDLQKFLETHPAVREYFEGIEGQVWSMAKQETSVKIMGKWLDAAQKKLNENQLKELSYRLVMYGLYQIEIECDDIMVDSMATMIYPQIDEMQEKYGAMQQKNEEKGDFYTQRDIWIWELAHNEGLKMAAIKERYDEKYGGFTPIDTLYKTQGWKQRMKEHPSFMEGNENKKEEISKLPNEIANVPKLENEEVFANLPNGNSVEDGIPIWQKF